MNPILRRVALALPVLLVAFGTSTAAQAAGSWSTPFLLPPGVGNAVYTENASGVQIAETGVGPQYSTSTDGRTWSAPVAISQGGTNPAFAIAPDGRIVAAWVLTTSSARTIQAAVRPPGGSWSTPVTVSGDDSNGPQIGMDSSGDAIIAWEGSTGTTTNGPVHTASLPAGGSWTSVTTLATAAGNIRLVANAEGGAIVAWGQLARAVWAASGTILGGLSAPVNVGRSSYGHVLGKPVLSLNDAGQAVMAWSNPATATSTLTLGGTWSALQFPNCSFPFNSAIDGAGNAIITCEIGTTSASGSTVTTYVVTRRPAGGAWGSPETLTSDFLGGIAAAASAGGTFVIAAEDATQKNLLTFTSPPGGDFGAAVPISTVALFYIAHLGIGGGRATVVWNTNTAGSSPGVFESTEPVT